MAHKRRKTDGGYDETRPASHNGSSSAELLECPRVCQVWLLPQRISDSCTEPGPSMTHTSAHVMCSQ